MISSRGVGNSFPITDEMPAKSVNHSWAWSTIDFDESIPQDNDSDLSFDISSYFKSVCTSEAIEIFLRSSKLFPIQCRSIPIVCESLNALYSPNNLSTCDICITAPTGSGKTLCYVAPICDRLVSCDDGLSKAIQNIVLVPSKLLVSQVAEVFFSLLDHQFHSKIVLLNGSKSFEQEQSMMASIKGFHWNSSLFLSRSSANVLISTPSRLFDHLNLENNSDIDFSFVNCVVLDECDKLLTSKNSVCIFKIFKILNNKKYKNIDYTINSVLYHRQYVHPILKIMLSATISSNLNPYYRLKLYKPCLIQLQTSKSFLHQSSLLNERLHSLTPNLNEFFVVADLPVKPMVILRLLLKFFKSVEAKVLCFVNSIETASRLSFLLNTHNKVRACDISSQLSPKKKNSIVNAFQKGQINVLVSTDASSRGMDFKNVSYVINYDAPTHAKTYIHRVGRTARAYHEGNAITFVPTAGKDKYLAVMNRISRSNRLKEIHIELKQLSPFEVWFDEALQLLKHSLKK